MNKLIQNIFSITNEGRHKVIRILGLKISLKRKIRLKDVNAKVEKLAYDMPRLVQAFQKSIAIANLHQKTFPKYKNIHNGQTIVICGAGPTLNNYEPIEGAIHIALNRAFLFDKVKFDYMFAQDWRAISHMQDEIKNYKGNNCVKFFGMQNGIVTNEIPEDFAIECKAERFGNNGCCIEMGDDVHQFAMDISSLPLGNFTSIAHSAMQFALWTNPKKIYLVGIDISSGHFINMGTKHESVDLGYMYDAWVQFKNFKNMYYPGVEIISINPVGLKGLFEDIYQEEKV